MCVPASCLPGFGRKEVVEYLLENGAKVNVHDDGELQLDGVYLVH